MNKRPGPLPFNDILDLIDELPDGPQHAGCGQPSGLAMPRPDGMLAQLAAWLATWQGRDLALVRRPVVAVFAASHAEPARMACGDTIQQIEELVAAAQDQTALVCRLCDLHGLGLRVFELAPEIPVRDFTAEAAMEEADCAATIAYGMEATAGGSDLLVVRTVAAGHAAAVAALAAGLLGERTVGPLAGIAHDAMACHGRREAAPLELLRRTGGRELSAVTGAILAARLQQVPVLLDGAGAVAAAVLLDRLRPGAAAHCVIAADDGHPDFDRLADASGRPVLLGGRHGEIDGSTGALAASLLQDAASVAAAPAGN